MVYKNIRNFLVLICLTIWFSVFSLKSNLQIVACDVGQGDAILIQKLNTQILIDGGPNQKVLDCLGKYMPYWDREIELVVNTHPEEDHYAGLIDVFKNYKVDVFGSNGQISSNQSYQVLEKLVGSKGTKDLILETGYQVRLGLIELDILWPIQKFQDSKNQKLKESTNDEGVVILLKYTQFKALFTADVENAVSDWLSEYSEIQNVNYLKVNHHGSKNGLSQKLLNAAKPEVAIISVGAKNSYGHPHDEILQMLKNINAKILRTDLMDDVDCMYDQLSLVCNNVTIKLK